MDAPLVSVIIRSTARPTLAAALACVAAQTHAAVEAVVVAASGAAHPPLPAIDSRHRLRLVESAVALSRPAAANAGIDAAAGEWITFLDDDDAIEPAHVEGLVQAAQRSGARIICSQARLSFADGSEQSWGQPFALTELYQRNFLHLSTVLFARTLVGAGCRFDTAFDIMQDWDFFLQMAQHAPFYSTGLRTFTWYADRGTSGTGGGMNQDEAKFARYRDRVYAKWRPARDALYARIEPLLQAAGQAGVRADWPQVRMLCESVLEIARNEPHALGMLATLANREGRADDAIAMQSLAISVRPHDPSLVVNLALLFDSRGEHARARRLAEHALRLEPGYAPAAKFIAQVDAR